MERGRANERGVHQRYKPDLGAVESMPRTREAYIQTIVALSQAGYTLIEVSPHWKEAFNNERIIYNPTARDNRIEIYRYGTAAAAPTAQVQERAAHNYSQIRDYLLQNGYVLEDRLGGDRHVEDTFVLVNPVTSKPERYLREPDGYRTQPAPQNALAEFAAKFRAQTGNAVGDSTK